MTQGDLHRAADGNVLAPMLCDPHRARPGMKSSSLGVHRLGEELQDGRPTLVLVDASAGPVADRHHSKCCRVADRLGAAALLVWHHLGCHVDLQKALRVSGSQARCR